MNKKLMKKLTAIGVAAAMTVPCGAVMAEESKDTEKKDVLIGLLVYNDKNEFIQKLIDGAQKKCDEYG